MSYITASTSVVLVATASATTSSIVYFPNISSVGRIITVRDNDGAASATKPILLSTIEPSQFVGIQNPIQIAQPYGFVTLTSQPNGNYTVLNTFAFPPGQTVAYVSNVVASTLTTQNTVNFRDLTDNTTNSLYTSSAQLILNSTILGTLTTANLQSTVAGLGSAGYLSSLQQPIETVRLIAVGQTSNTIVNNKNPNGTRIFTDNNTNWQIGAVNSVVGFSNGGTAVAYANGLYVAAGNNDSGASAGSPNLGYLQWSQDGSFWNNSVSPQLNNTQVRTQVAWGNGLWVAVGSNTGGGAATILYSGDGKNWSNAVTTTLFQGGFATGVVYGKGVWVVSGAGGALGSSYSLMWSTNGSNWNTATSVSWAASTVWDVAFTGSNFVAVLDGPAPNIATSTDGKNWSSVSVTGANLNGAARYLGVGNGMVLVTGSAAAGAGQLLKYSLDGGSTWNSNTSFTTGTLYRPYFDNLTWWVGLNNGSGAQAIYYSFTGSNNWSNQTIFGGFSNGGYPISFTATTNYITPTFQLQSTVNGLQQVLLVSTIQTNTLSTGQLNVANINVPSFTTGNLTVNQAATVSSLAANGISTTTGLFEQLYTSVLQTSTIQGNTAFFTELNVDNLSTSQLTLSSLTAEHMSTVTMDIAELNVSSLNLSVFAPTSLSTVTIDSGLVNFLEQTTSSIFAGVINVDVLSVGTFEVTQTTFSTLSTSILIANAISADTLQTNSISTGFLTLATADISTLSTSYISTTDLVGSRLFASSFAADTVSTGKLDLGSLSASSIYTNYISTGSLGATQANIRKLTASTISTATLEGVKNLSISDLSTNTLNVNKLSTGTLSLVAAGISTLSTSLVSSATIVTENLFFDTGAATTLSVATLNGTDVNVATVNTTDVNTVNVNTDNVFTTTVQTTDLQATTVTADTVSSLLTEAGTISGLEVLTSSISTGSIVTETLTANTGLFLTVSTGVLSLATAHISSLSTSYLSTAEIYAGQVYADVGQIDTVQSLTIIAVEADVDSIQAQNAAIEAISTSYISTNSVQGASISAAEGNFEKLSTGTVVLETAFVSTLSTSYISSSEIYVGDFTASKVYTSSLTADVTTTNLLNSAEGNFDKLSTGVLELATAYISTLSTSYISSSEIYVGELTSFKSFTSTLAADEVKTGLINATEGNFDTLSTGNLFLATAFVSTLSTNFISSADIYVGNMTATTVTANALLGSTATVDSLTATTAQVDTLNATTSVTSAGFIGDTVEVNNVSTYTIYAEYISAHTITVFGSNTLNVQGQANINTLDTKNIVALTVTADEGTFITLKGTTFSATDATIENVTFTEAKGTTMILSNLIVDNKYVSSMSSIYISTVDLYTGLLVADTGAITSLTAVTGTVDTLTATTATATDITTGTLSASEIGANTISSASIFVDTLSSGSVSLSSLQFVDIENDSTFQIYVSSGFLTYTGERIVQSNLFLSNLNATDTVLVGSKSNMLVPKKSIRISTDGISWTNATSGTWDYYGTAVAYSAAQGLWVATGYDSNALNTIRYSANGITWNSSASGGFEVVASQNYYYGGAIAWNSVLNLWVAGGYAQSRLSSLQYSTDGSNWKASKSGGFDTNQFFPEAKGVMATPSGVFYAVGTSRDTLLYPPGVGKIGTIQKSVDGSNWTNITSGGFDDGNGTLEGRGIATNGSGVYVAVGVGGTSKQTIQRSVNGTTFVNANTGGFDVGVLGGGNAVAYAGAPQNKWVAVGNASSAAATIQRSTDGLNWQQALSGGFNDDAGYFEAYDVTYSSAQNVWVAVGNSSNSATTIQTSTDGANWTPAASGFGYSGEFPGTAGTGVAFGQGKWVAVGTQDDSQNIYLGYSEMTESNITTTEVFAEYISAGTVVVFGSNTLIVQGNSDLASVNVSGTLVMAPNAVAELPIVVSSNIQTSSIFTDYGSVSRLDVGAFTVNTFITQNLTTSSILVEQPFYGTGVFQPIEIDTSVWFGNLDSIIMLGVTNGAALGIEYSAGPAEGPVLVGGSNFINMAQPTLNNPVIGLYYYWPTPPTLAFVLRQSSSNTITVQAGGAYPAATGLTILTSNSPSIQGSNASLLTPFNLSVPTLTVSSINGFEFNGGGGGSFSSNIAVSNVTTSSIFTGFASVITLTVSSINGFEFNGGGGGALSSNIVISNVNTSTLQLRDIQDQLTSFDIYVSDAVLFFDTAPIGGPPPLSSNLALSNLTTSSLFTEYASITQLEISSINGFEFNGSASISSNLAVSNIGVVDTVSAGTIFTDFISSGDILTSTIHFIDLITAQDIIMYVSDAALYVNNVPVGGGGPSPPISSNLAISNLSVVDTISAANIYVDFISSGEIYVDHISTFSLAVEGNAYFNSNLVIQAPANTFTSTFSSTFLSTIPVDSLNVWLIGGPATQPGSTIVYSTDSANWQYPSGFPIPQLNQIYSLGWTGKKWLLGGADNTSVNLSTIQYSSDAISWTGVSDPAKAIFQGQNNTCYSITSSPTLYVATGIAQDNNPLSTLQYSTDAISWSASVSGGFFRSGQCFGYDIAYKSTPSVNWVAVGYADDYFSSIQRSTDGSNWVYSGNGVDPAIYQFRSIAASPSVWVAGALNAPTNTTTLWYSADAINWNSSIQVQGSQFSGGLAWNGSYWLAGFTEASLGTGSTILKSVDGSNWITTSNCFQTDLSAPQSGSAFDFAWNGSNWTALGYSGYSDGRDILRSTDGFHWQAASNSLLTAKPPVSVAWGPLQLGSITSTITSTFQYNVTTGGTTLIQGGFISTADLYVNNINGQPYVPGGGGLSSNIAVSNIYTSSLIITSSNVGPLLVPHGGGSYTPIVLGTTPWFTNGQTVQFDNQTGAPTTVSWAAGMVSITGFINTGLSTLPVPLSVTSISVDEFGSIYSLKNVGGKIVLNTGSYPTNLGQTVVISVQGGGGGSAVTTLNSQFITTTTLNLLESGTQYPLNVTGGSLYFNNAPVGGGGALGSNLKLSNVQTSTLQLRDIEAQTSSFNLYVSDAVLYFDTAPVQGGGPAPVGSNLAVSNVNTSTLQLRDIEDATSSFSLYVSNAVLYFDTLPVQGGGSVSSNLEVSNVNTSTLSVTDTITLPYTYSNQYTIIQPSWLALGVGGSLENARSSILYSTDGSNWSYGAQSGGFFVGYSAAYNGSYWVATGTAYDDPMGSALSNTIQKSTDGFHWSGALSGGFDGNSGSGLAEGRAVLWTGTKWVAVGYGQTGGTDTIKTSTDGLHWANALTGGFNAGSSPNGQGIAWNGSYFVAVGQGNAVNDSIQKSTDGTHWQSATSGGFSDGIVTNKGYNVAWNGSYWVAVGKGSSLQTTIKKSTDGVHWTNALTGGFSNQFAASPNYEGFGIYWNSPYWVATGGASNTLNSIQRSTDGQNWVPSQSGGFTYGTDTIGYGVFNYNNSLWLTAGRDNIQGNTIQISTDASNWVGTTSGGFANFGRGFAFGSTTQVFTVTGPAATVLSYSNLSVLTISVSSINGLPYTGGGGGSVSSNLAVSNVTASSIFTKYASVSQMVVSSINGFQFTGSGGSVSSNLAVSNVTTSTLTVTQNANINTITLSNQFPVYGNGPFVYNQIQPGITDWPTNFSSIYLSNYTTPNLGGLGIVISGYGGNTSNVDFGGFFPWTTWQEVSFTSFEVSYSDTVSSIVCKDGFNTYWTLYEESGVFTDAVDVYEYPYTDSISTAAIYMAFGQQTIVVVGSNVQETFITISSVTTSTITVSTINGVPFTGSAPLDSNIALSNLTTSTILFQDMAGPQLVNMYSSNANLYFNDTLVGGGGSVSSNLAVSNVTTSSIFANIMSTNYLQVSTALFTGNVSINTLTVYGASTLNVVGQTNFFGGIASQSSNPFVVATPFVAGDVLSTISTCVSTVTSTITSTIVEVGNNTQFLATGQYNPNTYSTIQQSTDASNFTAIHAVTEPIVGGFPSYLEYNYSTNYVVIGATTDLNKAPRFSPDLSNWTYATVDVGQPAFSGQAPTGLVYDSNSAVNDRQFYLYQPGNADPNNRIRVSPDGSVWSVQDAPFPAILAETNDMGHINRMRILNNKIFIVGTNDKTPYYVNYYSLPPGSGAGKWLPAYNTFSGPPITEVFDIAFSPTLNRYVIVGIGPDNMNCIQYSDDLNMWNSIHLNPGNDGYLNTYSVDWDGSKFVAYGTPNGGATVIQTSPDGLNWAAGQTFAAIPQLIDILRYVSTIGFLGKNGQGDPLNSIFYNKTGTFNAIASGGVASGTSFLLAGGSYSNTFQSTITSNFNSSFTSTIIYSTPGSGGTTTIYGGLITVSSISVSSINGLPYTGSGGGGGGTYTLSSNLALSNVTTSSITSGYVSGISAYFSSINGYEFTGSGGGSGSVSSNLALSNVTTSSIFANYMSTNYLEVSTALFTGNVSINTLAVFGLSTLNVTGAANITTLNAGVFSVATLYVSSLNGADYSGGGSGAPLSSNLSVSNVTTSTLTTGLTNVLSITESQGTVWQGIYSYGPTWSEGTNVTFRVKNNSGTTNPITVRTDETNIVYQGTLNPGNYTPEFPLFLTSQYTIYMDIYNSETQDGTPTTSGGTAGTNFYTFFTLSDDGGGGDPIVNNFAWTSQYLVEYQTVTTVFTSNQTYITPTSLSTQSLLVSSINGYEFTGSGGGGSVSSNLAVQNLTATQSISTSKLAVYGYNQLIPGVTTFPEPVTGSPLVLSFIVPSTGDWSLRSYQGMSSNGADYTGLNNQTVQYSFEGGQPQEQAIFELYRIDTNSSQWQLGWNETYTQFTSQSGSYVAPYYIYLSDSNITLITPYNISTATLTVTTPGTLGPATIPLVNGTSPWPAYGDSITYPAPFQPNIPTVIPVYRFTYSDGQYYDAVAESQPVVIQYPGEGGPPNGVTLSTIGWYEDSGLQPYTAFLLNNLNGFVQAFSYTQSYNVAISYQNYQAPTNITLITSSNISTQSIQVNSINAIAFPKIQYGSVTVDALEGQTWMLPSITFTTAYTQTPAVTATLNSTDQLDANSIPKGGISVESVTTTGFNARLYGYGNPPNEFMGNVTFYWTAIGM